MLDTNNISSVIYVRDIKLTSLQAGSKITLTPSRHYIYHVGNKNCRTLSLVKVNWAAKTKYVVVKASLMPYW